MGTEAQRLVTTMLNMEPGGCGELHVRDMELVRALTAQSLKAATLRIDFAPETGSSGIHQEF